MKRLLRALLWWGVSFCGRVGRLGHRRQRHDQTSVDQALEVRREGPVADQETSLDVAFERLRGEVRGRDEHLLVVVDDRLGVEDRPGAVTLVDG